MFFEYVGYSNPMSILMITCDSVGVYSSRAGVVMDGKNAAVKKTGFFEMLFSPFNRDTLIII
jgi:hypothetical protein